MPENKGGFCKIDKREWRKIYAKPPLGEENHSFNELERGDNQ